MLLAGLTSSAAVSLAWILAALGRSKRAVEPIVDVAMIASFLIPGPIVGLTMVRLFQLPIPGFWGFVSGKLVANCDRPAVSRSADFVLDSAGWLPRN